MNSSPTSPPTEDECFGRAQIDELLIGRRLESTSTNEFVIHLLSPCESCWGEVTKLLQQASGDDRADFFVSGDALLRAVWCAALAQERPPTERFLLLRPTHRRDAEAAQSERLAFLRLLLHEAFAACLQDPRDQALAPLDGASIWVGGHCIAQDVGSPEQNDLKALELIYRAYLALERDDGEAAERYLKVAFSKTEEGAGHGEPTVAWHEVRAIWHRRRGRTFALQAAKRNLTNALRLLEVEGNDQHRAEILLDLGQMHLELGKPLLARSDLQRADELLDLPHGRVDEVVSPGLRTLVVTTWIQAEHQLAMGPPSADQQQAASRLVELVDRVSSHVGIETRKPTDDLEEGLCANR